MPNIERIHPELQALKSGHRMWDGRTDRLEPMYPQQICCMGAWGVQWNKYEQYRWINHKNQWRLSNTIWTNTLWTKTHIYASFVWAYLKQFSHMLCWAWYSHRPLSDRLETAPLTAQRPQVSCARCRPATATARIRESATRSQQLDWHNCIRHWIYCLYGPQVA